MSTPEDETTNPDPRQMSREQLAALGVERLNKHALVLKCVRCGETWTPAVDHNGKLVAGYWICPEKCNV